MGLAAAAPAIQSALERQRSIAPIVADQPSRKLIVRSPTPMGARVATLGILNKRNGLARDLVMRPGQAVRLGDAVVRLSACDQTEPWEREQLTGAFVQLIVRGADSKWRRYFSGWLYKETPSLNVVEHPVYDVWVKACTMQHPDIGPETVVLSGDEPSPQKRSSAAKSPAAEPSAPASEAPDNAPSSTPM